MNRFWVICTLFFFCLLASQVCAKSPVQIGWCVDDHGKSHFCHVDHSWYQPEDTRTRVLLIQASTDVEISGFAEKLRRSSELRDQMIFASIAIPVGMQEDWLNTVERGFPPSGDFYKGEDAIRQYLWRFVGALGTDIIVLVYDSNHPTKIHVPDVWSNSEIVESGETSLFAAASKFSPANTGVATSIEHSCNPAVAAETLLSVVLDKRLIANAKHSSAGVLRSRQTRSTRKICQSLVDAYGESFRSMSYIPALTMRAKYRFGQLTANPELQLHVLDSVGRFANENPTLMPKSGSAIGGHLVYSHLALQQTENPDIWIRNAHRGVQFALDYDGEDENFLMPHHSEMSDAVFMSGPLLAEVSVLTQSSQLKRLCIAHIGNMAKMNLRPDGLHRHSPLDSAAWGRGNGFPALGLALTLDAIGTKRSKLLSLYQNHVDALLVHQDASGMWHQVIDHPGTYAEFTSTCMISYAILRGIRNGWLKGDKYYDALTRAATAIKARIADDGVLLDVCTGTGKQRSLEDYFHRTAILGKDARGGAMALTFMVELLDWEMSKDD